MKRSFYLAAFAAILTLSGCLTSEEPFYQEGDIRVEDQLIGTYGDATNPSQSTRLYISKVSDFEEHKGRSYVSVSESPSSSMRFGAVLFQIGTNRFFDMIPVLEASDHLAGNPPSLVELLQSATLRPMHLVVKVDMDTNGVRFGFADYPSLVKVATAEREYFEPVKPGQLPRMAANTARAREFLARFGGDTNIFRLGQFAKSVNGTPKAIAPDKKTRGSAASRDLRGTGEAAAP